MYTCLCVCVCVCVYDVVYMCVCMCILFCACMYVCIHVCVYVMYLSLCVVSVPKLRDLPEEILNQVADNLDEVSISLADNGLI